MKDLYVIAGDPKGELVRRRIVVWRRLEPGDVPSPGSLAAPENPFLEARVLEIGLGKELHTDMVRLAAERQKATAITGSLMASYEPGGMLLAAGGGLWVGAWFDFLRPHDAWQWAGLATFAVGCAVAFVAKQRRNVLEREAAERWKKNAERQEHDEVARELAQKWLAFSQRLKKEDGFHTEVRVAEGSANPMRLASIDPGPMADGAGFDPQDWLPTEGGGVRYETLQAAGEIATKEFPGSLEVGQVADAESESESESESASESDSESESESASEVASEAEAERQG